MRTPVLGCPVLHAQEHRSASLLVAHSTPFYTTQAGSQHKGAPPPGLLPQSYYMGLWSWLTGKKKEPEVVLGKSGKKASPRGSAAPPHALPAGSRLTDHRRAGRRRGLCGRWRSVHTKCTSRAALALAAHWPVCPAPAAARSTQHAPPTPRPGRLVRHVQICCSCPETKAARDACTIQYGPEAKECQELIEAHKKCLREEGFNVRAGHGTRVEGACTPLALRLPGLHRCGHALALLLLSPA